MHRRTFLKRTPLALGAAVAACRRPLGGGALGVGYAPPPLPADFLFATGIENSYPLLADGSRNDQLARCGHDARWKEDFALARGLGVGALRYGPAWYRTNPAPGRYDWSGVDERMEWLRASGLVVVADLCHFGVPDWMDGFQDPALPVHLAAYAREFARRYPWVRHFTPVNEIFVGANFSAMLGWWNERRTGRASFARALRNMCVAHELAVESILGETASATIVQAESFERFAPADDGADAAAQARFWNEARFAALDLTLGRTPGRRVRELLVEGGMTTSDFAFLRERRAPDRRWIGVDYYVTSEQLVDGSGRKWTAPRRAGLAALAREYHERYDTPLFISETSRTAADGVAWLGEQWRETRHLVAAGIPIRGFTWFPLGDVLDWRHALRERRGDVDAIGLYDLARRPNPVARAYAELIAAEARVVATAGRELARGRSAAAG